jgi:predicted transcriptional regulator
LKTPCELIVGKIMPSLRSAVVKELSHRYEMKQSDIAKRLGITQASVSQYLSSTRAGDKKMVENFPKIKRYAAEIAKRISSGESKFEWSIVLCDACKDIRSDEEFSSMIAKLQACDICKKS